MVVVVVDFVDDEKENLMEVAVERVQSEILEESDDEDAGDDDDNLEVFGISLGLWSRWC